MACWSSIEGTWSYKDMIGAKFKLKSLPISIGGVLQRGCSFRYSQMELTLMDIYFRVSTDGKVIPLFRMKEVCGKLFLPRDLELIEISPVLRTSTICGEFVCGNKTFVGTGTNDISSDGGYSDSNSDKSEIPDNSGEDNINTATTTSPNFPDNEEDGGYIFDIIAGWEVIGL